MKVHFKLDTSSFTSLPSPSLWPCSWHIQPHAIPFMCKTHLFLSSFICLKNFNSLLEHPISCLHCFTWLTPTHLNNISSRNLFLMTIGRALSAPTIFMPLSTFSFLQILYVVSLYSLAWGPPPDWTIAHSFIPCWTSDLFAFQSNGFCILCQGPIVVW